MTNDPDALNLRSARTLGPEGGAGFGSTGAKSEKIRRTTCGKHAQEKEEASSNLPTKRQVFGGTSSVSSEVFADTGSLGLDKGLGPLGRLGGFRLDRGLELWGSFNTFTMVTTNLCNSNIFRDQNFGDVPWGDPNSQRLVGHKEMDS